MRLAAALGVVNVPLFAFPTAVSKVRRGVENDAGCCLNGTLKARLKLREIMMKGGEPIEVDKLITKFFLFGIDSSPAVPLCSAEFLFQALRLRDYGTTSSYGACVAGKRSFRTPKSY